MTSLVSSRASRLLTGLSPPHFGVSCVRSIWVSFRVGRVKSFIWSVWELGGTCIHYPLRHAEPCCTPCFITDFQRSGNSNAGHTLRAADKDQPANQPAHPSVTFILGEVRVRCPEPSRAMVSRLRRNLAFWPFQWRCNPKPKTRIPLSCSIDSSNRSSGQTLR